MKVVPFSEAVFSIEQGFDGVDVRGVVVVGKNHALIWDALIFPDELRKLAGLCAGRELLVVYSHADWDHVWGACGLPGVRIIAHHLCARRFANPHDVERTLQQYKAKSPARLAAITLCPPTETFQNSLVLDLGGISVEISHCPGHSADSIVAFIPEHGLLLAGDSVETPLPLLNEPSTDVSEWMAVLESFAADRRFKVCVPAHGPTGGRELIAGNLRYLADLKQGLAFELPSGLDDFYKKGHAANLRHVK